MRALLQNRPGHALIVICLLFPLVGAVTPDRIAPLLPADEARLFDPQVTNDPVGPALARDEPMVDLHSEAGTVDAFVRLPDGVLAPVRISYAVDGVARELSIDTSTLPSGHLLLPQGFIEARLPDPALVMPPPRGDNDTLVEEIPAPLRLVVEGAASYVQIDAAAAAAPFLRFRDFHPSATETLYGRGSARTVELLERPMAIRLGGLGYDDATGVFELVVHFDDPDASGQPVAFSKSWLQALGFRAPTFSHAGEALAAEDAGDRWIVRPPHFSPVMVWETFPTNPTGGWSLGKTGGPSFQARALATYTQTSVSAPYAIQLATGGDFDGGDYGTVYAQRDLSIQRVDVLTFWFLMTMYDHTGGQWDGLTAGVRLMPRDSVGNTLATYTYVLAGWTQDQDVVAGSSTTKVLHADPLSNDWVHVQLFPTGDFSASWTGASTVRVEFFATGGGFAGDQFDMTFDDLVVGQDVGLLHYEQKGSKYASSTSGCGTFSFRVPSTTKFVYVGLWMAATPLELNLQVTDASGRTNGAIPNSAYSGTGEDPEWLRVSSTTSYGLWNAGCATVTGGGAYRFLASVFVDIRPTAGTENDSMRFNTDGGSYRVDVELQMPTGANFDLSLVSPSGKRTGGAVVGDGTTRTNIDSSLYSGAGARPEWVFVDPPRETGTWTVKVYSVSGSGPFLAKLSLRNEKAFWGVHMHMTDATTSRSFPLDAVRTNQAFTEIALAGATKTRVGDLSWSSFQSSQGAAWQWSQVRHVMRYVSWAHSRGLDPILIVNYDRSGWNWNLYQTDANAFFSGWNTYCSFVTQQFGRFAYLYQISNEENAAWPAPSSVGQGDEPRLYYECVNGLYAGRGIGITGHARFLKTIVNPLVDNGDDAFCSWSCRLNNWFGHSTAGPRIDVASLDHYPDTWSEGGLSCHWDDLATLQSIALSHGKRPAISELGYSSFATWHNEADQANWVDCSLPKIRDMVIAHNGANPGRRYEFASWYEFIDDDSGGGGNPEMHFGLLHTDMSKKAAYDRFKAQVATYGI